jgi:N-acetyl-alpha-D-muramate 1-phosphate uridylyltransferase
MKAMVLAAGLGIRLKPITLTKPKALAEINGIPLIEIIINKLIKSDFNEIIINVHHFPDQIKNYLKGKNNFGIRIEISDESDTLLGTGGGLKKAGWFFDDQKPFLVYNVDILSDIDIRELFNFHLKQKLLATLAVRNRKSDKYFLFDEENILCGWKNTKTGETKVSRKSKSKLKEMAFSGIQVVDPKILKLMPHEEIFSLVDLYLSNAEKNKIVAFNDNSSFFIDAGKPENLKEAERYFQSYKL